MRIDAVWLHRVRIPFSGSFGHALSERRHSDAVFVQLRDEQGGDGWGEILPRSYVTGETLEGVLERSGPAVAQRLLGAQLGDRIAVEAWIDQTLAQVGRDLATFGGFEIALLDRAGRRFGVSLADWIGGEPGASESLGPALPPGVIIGFEVKTDALKKHCIGLRWKGHTHVKVKVGLPDDAERLAVITRVFGPKVPLRLDANMAWTVDEAVQRLRSLSQIPIASIEQPVAADDLAGMHTIRERTGVAVMADEAICSLDDAQRLARAQAADIFNIRVGKHGGIRATRAIVECARQAEISIHLGTLVGESGVLSRVAEVFGRCVPGFACLDGKGQNRFLLEEDVLALPSADAKNPAVHAALDRPGLGVDVNPEVIGRLRMGDPIELRA
ncbi:MAG: enolase C-terminal domain-like protein [Myxococcota bacterium]